MKKTPDSDAPPLPFSGNDEKKKRNGLKSNEIAQRKRILGERNGFSSCPNSPEKKNPIDSNPNEVNCGSAGSGITNINQFRISPLNSSSSSKISNSDHGERKSAPYDPTTNFLSPRPKFLRYNPNWRREIILSRGKIEDLTSDVESQSGTEQGESSVSDSVSSGSSSLGGELIKAEPCVEFEENDDGVEIEEEVEVEEEELESFKGLKWVLKCSLVFAVLFLSTAYISTMNSPTPPPALLAVRGLGDECGRVGGGLLKSLFEMKRFHGGLFEVGVSDYSPVGVEDDDVDVEEEIAKQLGEVVEVDDGGEEDNGKEMMSYEVENDGIIGEVNNSFDDTTHQVFDGGFFKEEEEVVGTEVSDEKITEDNGLQIVEEAVVTTHQVFDVDFFKEEEVVVTEVTEFSDGITEESNSLQIVEEVVATTHQVFDEGLLKKEEVIVTEVGEVNGIVSEELDGEEINAEVGGTLLNWKDNLVGLITTKVSICIAMLSLLVAVCGSLVLRLQLNCKKTPSMIAAEARELKRRAPCLPRTLPKPRESSSILPEVKLLGELEFGDVCSPVQNYNHTRNQRFVSNSPSNQYSVWSEDLGMMDSAASYRGFTTEEKITLKKVREEGKQVAAAAADMGLSGTPVRRSVRIRSRQVTSP